MFKAAGILARNPTSGAQQDASTMATKLKGTVNVST